MASSSSPAGRLAAQGRPRGDLFAYVGVDLDPCTARVTLKYRADREDFIESYTFDPEGDWTSPAVAAAARLLFLVVGVSYYKTTAARAIDFGADGLSEAEARFLREYYVQGLGEFAYKNGLDLSGLEFRGGQPSARGAGYRAQSGRPLIPFGGGIDSIVSTELMRPASTDPALFVVNRRNDKFAAIEAPAAATGLPIVRAEREIDPKVLASASRGYFNGHVPVTGVISAAAVFAAVLADRDAVVMSNEWSASSPTLVANGVPINHQWSKSLEFETLFRELVAAGVGTGLQYFSRLRSYSELRIARIFSTLETYHRSFRSCNRAFSLNPELRLDHWCGECDKCCFIDLILAPFMSRDGLRKVFGGIEPLDRPDLLDRFRTLLGTTPGAKPFECVGDLEESIAAVGLAASDPARADQLTLQALRGAVAKPATTVEALLGALGSDFVPEPYASAADLG